MNSSKIKTIIFVVIGIILLLLLTTIGFSVYTISSLKSNLQVQVNTRTIIVALKDNLANLLDAETAGRGYFITSDTNYLEPLNNAEKNIPENMGLLRNLSKDQPVMKQQLDTMDRLISNKINLIKKVVFLKQAGADSTIKKMIPSGSGKLYMDSIRNLNKRMQLQQEKLFSERQETTSNSIGHAQIVFIIEGILSLTITLFLATLIIKELNRRTRTEQLMMKNNHELEIKNKEIEQFAYVASHDLQEPLRSISNFTNLLNQKLQNNPEKDVQQYMKFISGASVRMSTLIFDLLEYSRVGKNMNKASIDCNKIVKEILSDMSAAINEKKAVVNVGPLPVVNGYVYLRSLFQNLISNTLKFTRPDVIPEINITAAERDRDYLFSIQDNGIGIEKEYFERIFIIFQRLHGRAEYPGTGIGLAICKKIVELHEGVIWVESEFGKGTTFNFTISKTIT